MNWITITLAVIGGLGLLLILLCVLDDKFGWSDPVHHIPDSPNQYGTEKDLRDLDYQIRGDIWMNPYSSTRGRSDNYEVTLNGRVKAIEEHLGLEISVKPAEPAKVVVKKTRKRSK